MSTPPAKPRPRRRLVLPPLTDGQQVLFTFDDGFPKNQRKPEAQKVLAARRRRQSTSVVVPDGMHVQVREGADRDWHLIEPSRGRGRRPKVPAGTCEDDDDFLAEVSAIVGKDRRDRKASGPAIVEELQNMAGRRLGRTLTTKEHDRLWAVRSTAS